METAEVEFIAECYPVQIVPKFNHPAIHLISGDIGPFMAGMPIQVPLWAAVSLRQQHKCRILPPDWMTVTELERLKQAEKESQVFIKIPTEHYREVAHLLIDTASSDIPQAEEVQILVKDLWDIRLAKLRASTDVFIKSDQVHAQVDHLTMMELNSVRPLLLKSLRHISQLNKLPTGQNSVINESGTISISVASEDTEEQ